VNKKWTVLFASLMLAVVLLAGCSSASLPLAELVAGVGAAQAPAAQAPAAQAPAVVQNQDKAPDGEASDAMAILEETLGGIYAQVSPSVVNIQVVQDASAAAAMPQVPGLPFGAPTPEDAPAPRGAPRGLGSGFVWDQKGHIVTNNHVVADAAEIRVVFSDGTSAPAEVVGTDPHSDLAVIRVDLPADQLQPIQVADSTEVNVGQLAVAIGNPFGLEGTMTVGFVSALGRSLPVAPEGGMRSSYTIPDVIQTDAPINPGNSGGVLVNRKGQLIGVPTAIESPVRANAGIGFAVPAAIVQQVVPDLIETGEHEHPWLGVSGMSLRAELAEAMGLDANQRGVLVMEVVEDGPAAEAGLRGSDREVEIEGQEVPVGGDVIVAIEGQEVKEFEDLVAYLARSVSVGETVTLTVLRDNSQETVEVTLSARPEVKEPEIPPASEAPAGVWLGIQGGTLTPEMAEAMDLDADQDGVLVGQVIQGSPAYDAGLRGSYETTYLNGQPVPVGGDVIVGADDTPVAEMEDLHAFLSQAEPGQEVS
jgi:S1-C subfamily serine protease